MPGLDRPVGIVIYNSSMGERRNRSSRLVTRTQWLFGLVLAAACGSGCGAPLDVESTLTVTDVTTGWLDVGLDEIGRNKLVPTISFRLENVSERDDIRTLQLNGVFRRCLQAPPGQPMPVSDVSPADEQAGTCAGEPQEWGNAYVHAVGREGLDPGMAAGPFTMESGQGYTGEQSRIEMLEHRDFVDVKLEIFVKHRSNPWVRLSEHLIDRQLLTQ